MLRRTCTQQGNDVYTEYFAEKLCVYNTQQSSKSPSKDSTSAIYCFCAST